MGPVRVCAEGQEDLMGVIRSVGIGCTETSGVVRSVGMPCKEAFGPTRGSGLGQRGFGGIGETEERGEGAVSRSGPRRRDGDNLGARPNPLTIGPHAPTQDRRTARSPASTSKLNRSPQNTRPDPLLTGESAGAGCGVRVGVRVGVGVGVVVGVLVCVGVTVGVLVGVGVGATHVPLTHRRPGVQSVSAVQAAQLLLEQKPLVQSELEVQSPPFAHATTQSPPQRGLRSLGVQHVPSTQL